MRFFSSSKAAPQAKGSPADSSAGAAAAQAKGSPAAPAPGVAAAQGAEAAPGLHILVLADEPVNRLWSEFGHATLRAADLILSCGDLPATYLSYITCFTSAPVIYVHGNHDHAYAENPVEGCICADGHVILAKGLRILGLDGSMRYRPDAPCMYSEPEMETRIAKLKRELKQTGGFDILLTHSPIAGLGDQPDLPHRGFECFKGLLRENRPAVMFHGHVHQAYSGANFTRIREFEGIPVINACGSFEYDFPGDYVPKGVAKPRGVKRMQKQSEP